MKQPNDAEVMAALTAFRDSNPIIDLTGTVVTIVDPETRVILYCGDDERKAQQASGSYRMRKALHAAWMVN